MRTGTSAVIRNELDVSTDPPRASVASASIDVPMSSEQPSSGDLVSRCVNFFEVARYSPVHQ